MAVGLVPCHLAMVSTVGFLNGIFLILFCASAYLLVKRQRHLNTGSASSRNTSVWSTAPFIGSVLLLLTVIPHWIVVVDHSFQAFVYHANDPYAFYADSMNPSFAAETAFSIIVPLLADAMLIWRLWLIWDYNRLVVAVPILIWVGAIAAGFGALIVESVHKQPRVNKWMSGCYGASAAINVICCALIAQRLLAISAKSHSLSSAVTSRVLEIFIESAGLYVAWMVISFAMYETQNGVREALVPIAGIAFMLINVRVGMGYALPNKSPHTFSESHTSASRQNATQISSPIKVNITHSVSQAVDEQLRASEVKFVEGDT